MTEAFCDAQLTLVTNNDQPNGWLQRATLLRNKAPASSPRALCGSTMHTFMARFSLGRGCCRLPALGLVLGLFPGCTKEAGTAVPPARAVTPVVASAESETASASTPRLGAHRMFVGMCDASGAVPLGRDALLVADDEDNVLRVYDADRGGLPLHQVDVSQWLGLEAQASSRKAEKPPETDIEAATRLADLAFWLTSHGRSSSGKFRPERLRLFATRVADGDFQLDWVGSYEGLLSDLLGEPRLARFELTAASERAPKDPGGLNIEGMTARAEGGVWIGFRNPVPAGRALLVPLLNPEKLVTGAEKAAFGEPLTLDLSGLGIRSLSSWRGSYLIVAGHTDSEPGSALYTWNGRDQPVRIEPLDFGDLNPEGFFSPEQRDSFMLLSDDGTRLVSGKECKRLKVPSEKTFRGVWVALR